MIIPLLLLINSATAKLVDSFLDCGLNNQSRELARLVVNDREQKRSNFRCDNQLSMIAQAKAREMALEGKVNHESVSGGPNQRLLSAGYLLPKVERLEFNTVEALLGGQEDANETLKLFKRSIKHRQHLLGEHPFYKKQTQIGVGYYEKNNTPHKYYWVVYISNKSLH